jgi:hypothetical protein
MAEVRKGTVVPAIYREEIETAATITRNPRESLGGYGRPLFRAAARTSGIESHEPPRTTRPYSPLDGPVGFRFGEEA